MAQISLRELQFIELDIFKKVQEVCDKHHLTYYALGGTLLGAVRHKGIIPWDDDIDIGLPRPDYERFIKIASQELNMPYEVVCIQNNNSEYYYYYARVVNRDIRLMRHLTEKDTVINAWIDVFPLDGVPEKEEEFDRWYKKAYRLKRKLEFSQFMYFYNVVSPEGIISNRNRTIKTIGKKIIQSTRIYKLIDTQKTWNQLDKTLKAYRYEASSRLFNFCGFWGIKELFPKEYYGEGVMYQFEDTTIRGPVNYDAVLTQMYGDYMTPPKDSDKEHHFIEIL